MAINNILEGTFNSYPIFKPNQVLTDGQLNNIVQYLDGQNRLTRVLLLGTGIACGFEPVWVEASKALQISAGFGVTSDGYLIHESAQSLNLYRRREVPAAWFGFNNLDSLPNSFIAEELSSGIANEPDSIFSIDSKSFLTNKVLIYVLELNNQDNLGLCNNDCDGRSDSLQFNLHKLLFSEKDALTILAKTYEIDTAGGSVVLQHTFYEKYFMTQLALPRFGYELEGTGAGQSFSARLEYINSYDIFRNKYATILQKYVGELSTALQQAHLIFSPVLTPGETTTTVVALPAALVTKINNRTYDPFEVQYLYDHLADLTDAYEEFVEAAFDLIADCNITPKHFPNHLMVRKFNAAGDTETEPYSVYHTPYTQPPIYNGNNSRLNEVRTLFERLIALAGNYTTPSVLGKDEIKVTPSKSFRAPLSERAVPYYYPISLANVWSPHQNRRNRKGKVYSYHRPTEAPYSDPLVFEMQGSDFFRIEGHVGQDFMEVMGKLNMIQLKYNLPFSTIALKIDDVFDDELFQFECENFECELAELRDRYTQLKLEFERDVIQKLDETDRGKLTKEFVDSLPNELDDFNYKVFSTQYAYSEKRSFRVGNAEEVIGLLPSEAKLAFQQINECRTDILNRLEEVKKRHLFHYFANKYPGLDHKGGVPFGGTFILAYVDPKIIPDKIRAITAGLSDQRLAPIVAESRLVVADFYLPYACCSNCPPICYMVARPKPVFTIEPNVFCLQDAGVKVLEIFAHPGGGKVSGPGYRFEGGEHLFVPAQCTPDANSQVTLYYLVDGAEAVALITLVPPPAADFDILLGANSVDHICEGEGPVTLQTSGVSGQFTVIKDGVETPLTNNTYASQDIEVEAGQQIEVTFRYKVHGNYCDNQIDKILTILPLPNTAFSFNNNVTQVCKDDGNLQLIPEEPGGVFAAFVGNVPAPGAITLINGNSFLKLAAFAPNPGESGTVSVVHTITPVLGCPNHTTREIQVFARPTAEFRFDGEDNGVCQTGPPVNFTITSVLPENADVKFIAKFDGKELLLTKLQNNLYQLNPASVNILPGTDSTEVTLQLEITSGPCASATDVQMLVVIAPPNPSFDLEFLDEAGSGNFTLVRVSNIKPVDAGSYTWTSEPPSSSLNARPDAKDFIIQYPNDVTLPITLTLVVERAGCFAQWSSEPLLPDVQRFELLGVVNPNAPPTVLRFELQDNEVIPESELTNFESFNIRAVTRPNIVKNVDLELSGTLTRSTTSSTPRNYKFDGTLPVNLGLYNIKAIPFAHNDQAGEDLIMTFTIQSDLELPQDPSEETINFLRKRDTKYRNSVKDLGDNNVELAQTPAFQLSSGFVNFQGTSDEFNTKFSTVSTALMEAAAQATLGTQEHTRLLNLMELTTQYYMDRQVFLAPNNLSAATTKILQDQIAAMKISGVKIAAMQTAWSGNALKKQLSAKSVDTILKLLK